MIFKNKIVIAFDVASNKTGYAVLINKKYFTSGVIDATLKKDDAQKWKHKSLTINIKLNELIWKIRNHVQADKKGELNKIDVIYEYNEHGFISTTKKLMFALGIYTAAISNLSLILFPNDLKHLNYKFVSAQEWQSKLRERNKQMAGEYTKEHSLQFANSLLKRLNASKKLITSDDEAEALIMAHFHEKLRDKETVRLGIITTAKELKSIRRKIYNSELMVKKYNIIKTTKEKLNKKLTKHEREMLEKHTDKLEKAKLQLSELQNNKIWRD